MREDVERTERFEAWEAHVIEASNNEVSAKFVFSAHGCDVGFTVLECFDGGILSHGVCAKDGVLVHLHHGVRQRCGGTGVPDPEACHCERFGESVQENGSFAHPWERGDGDVFRVVVRELGVDFVGEDDEVVLDAERGDAFEFLAGLGGTGRIAREVHHQGA